MKLSSIRQAGVWAAALGLCCVALASAPAAHAEDKMTAQSLIDRQLILDQITRYYYNFGKAERHSEESFYAEDGELILGTRHYKVLPPSLYIDDKGSNTDVKLATV